MKPRISYQRGCIKVVSLGDFDQFVGYIGKEHWHTHGVLFRGQREARWGLSTSLARLMQRTVEKEHRVPAVLQSHGRWSSLSGKENFAERLPAFVPESGGGDVLLWSLMQHHGGASPLLDWSRSPYVAAFFAFADVALNTKTEQRSKKRLAVWALRCAIADDLAEANPDLDFRIYSTPLPNNPRLIAQQGCFTYHASALDLEKELSASSPKGRHRICLEKITLPWECWVKALAHLNRMNVNYATLFPDLHGAALHATLTMTTPSYEGRNPRKDEQLIRHP